MQSPEERKTKWNLYQRDYQRRKQVRFKEMILEIEKLKEELTRLKSCAIVSEK